MAAPPNKLDEVTATTVANISATIGQLEITLTEIQRSANEVTEHSKAALTLNTSPTCGAHGVSTKVMKNANDIASHVRTLRANNERIYQLCVEALAETKTAYRTIHSARVGRVVESSSPPALGDVLARGEKAMEDARAHFDKALKYYDNCSRVVYELRYQTMMAEMYAQFVAEAMVPEEEVPKLVDPHHHVWESRG